MTYGCFHQRYNHTNTEIIDKTERRGGEKLNSIYIFVLVMCQLPPIRQKFFDKVRFLKP